MDYKALLSTKRTRENKKNNWVALVIHHANDQCTTFSYAHWQQLNRSHQTTLNSAPYAERKQTAREYGI
jgi:hypothetical protein